MKWLAMVVGLLLSIACYGAEHNPLPAERIKALVSAVNDASNRMMLKEAKPSDIDTLFSMYADDFVYIHDAYGGLYPRASLYENSLRNMQAGRFNVSADRYKILNIMTGLDAAAVERLEINSGQVHLSIFEFRGDKVSKIVEYWQ